MSLTRRVARPLLAASFISGGVDTLRNPEPRVAMAETVAPKVAEPLPLPNDPDQLVKINAVVQVVAGILLAIGRLPRFAACALAGSLVPTTLAGHRFWEEDDPARRHQQQIHFFKNLGLLGGLVLAAADTGGAPSLGWRARRAARRVRRKVS
ncbi:MAG TPA: DoxX family protein [Acidimicrobiales bacterium]|jgi:putative oxidoreductase|nr:DoxX family protein [Acidimicrobiales bacterium]